MVGKIPLSDEKQTPGPGPCMRLVNSTSTPPNCADVFKSRRVSTSKTSLTNSSRDSCGSTCERSKMDVEFKPTELIPKHLVGMTPGLPHSKKQVVCLRHGPNQPASYPKPSPMDLDMIGEHKVALKSIPKASPTTRVEKTISEACKKVSALLSKGKENKLRRSPEFPPAYDRADVEVAAGTHDPKENVMSGRLVTGCNNNWGKGYKSSYFGKHLYTHKTILLKSADEREKVTYELQKFGNRVLCKRCCMVVAQTNRDWLCKSCSSLDEVEEVSNCLSNSARNRLINSCS